MIIPPWLGRQSLIYRNRMHHGKVQVGIKIGEAIYFHPYPLHPKLLIKSVCETWKYTLLNHKRNEEILEELHVTQLEDKLCTYRHKWFQHVYGLEDNRLPKQLLNCHPKERRRPGRPLKRLLDDMTAETETDHPGLNSCGIWWWY
jgi:hypothetical protein